MGWQKSADPLILFKVEAQKRINRDEIRQALASENKTGLLKMMYLVLAAGYVPLFGIMYYYAESRYYKGRRDERNDICVTEIKKKRGSDKLSAV